MIKKISKTSVIRERLIRDSKLTYLNDEADIKALNEMNQEMEEVRREYKIKERSSLVSAANVLLTA
jgi:hypothetical protein